MEQKWVRSQGEGGNSQLSKVRKTIYFTGDEIRIKDLSPCTLHYLLIWLIISCPKTILPNRGIYSSQFFQHSSKKKSLKDFSVRVSAAARHSSTPPRAPHVVRGRGTLLPHLSTLAGPWMIGLCNTRLETTNNNYYRSAARYLCWKHMFNNDLLSYVLKSSKNRTIGPIRFSKLLQRLCKTPPVGRAVGLIYHKATEW